MNVYEGSTDVSEDPLWTYSTSPTTSATLTYSGGNTRTVTVSAMTTDTATITITASKPTYSSIARTFTITKSKGGIQGGLGPTVVVTPNRGATFSYTDGVSDGDTINSNITLTATVNNMPTPITYAWSFVGFPAGSVPANSASNTVSITRGNLGTAKSATAKCLVNNTYFDTITITRLDKSTAAAGADSTSTALTTGVSITDGGITLGSGGSFKGGQTDYNTGNGFFLGYSSGYKFSIGTANGAGMRWDGSTLTVQGTINASSYLASGVTVTGLVDGNKTLSQIAYTKTNLEATLAAGVANVLAGVGGDYVLEANTTNGWVLLKHKDLVYPTSNVDYLTGNLRTALAITSTGIAMGYQPRVAGAFVPTISLDSTTGVASFSGAVNASSITTTGPATFNGTVNALGQLANVYAGGSSPAYFGLVAVGTTNGVYGYGPIGVKGNTSSQNGEGVYGTVVNSTTAGFAMGVRGQALGNTVVSRGANLCGVYGQSGGLAAANVIHYGVYGVGTQYGVYSDGTLGTNGQILSTVASGTPPISLPINSLMCTNLDANKLQGNLASAFATSGHNHSGVYAASSHDHTSYAAYIGGSTANSATTTYSTFVITSDISGVTVKAGAAETSYANRILITASSDRRLKEQIEPEKYGLNFINALLPVSYYLIGASRRQHGFIAQDIEGLIDHPDDSLKIVQYDGTKGVDYISLISPLVKAIQELTKRVQDLEAKYES